MNSKYTIIVLFAFFHGPLVAAQEIQKCWLGNSTCEQEAFVKLALHVFKYGIPELDIPALIPMPLENDIVRFLDMITITVNKGQCFGIETCRILSFENNVTSFRKISEVNCGRLVIQGSYTIATDPRFKKLIGNVSGCGNVSIVAEDCYYKIDYPYTFVKDDDGEIHLKPDFKAGAYIAKVLKNFTVSFNNIVLNGKDITKSIVCFLNKNWKLVLDTIGKPFHDASLDYYIKTYDKFYSGLLIADSYYDDLTQYINYN